MSSTSSGHVCVRLEHPANQRGVLRVEAAASTRCNTSSSCVGATSIISWCGLASYDNRHKGSAPASATGAGAGWHLPVMLVNEVSRASSGKRTCRQSQLRGPIGRQWGQPRRRFRGCPPTAAPPPVGGQPDAGALLSELAEGHQGKRPCESRLWQSQNPWPSYMSTFTAVPLRLRKTNTVPVNGSCWSFSWHIRARAVNAATEIGGLDGDEDLRSAA